MSESTKCDLLKRLIIFNSSAELDLNLVGTTHVEKGDYERVRNEIDPEEDIKDWSALDKAIVLRTRRLLAGLYDHQGDYANARLCLGDTRKISDDLERFRPVTDEERDLFAEHVQILWMESVADHRDGDSKKALTTTERLRALMDRLPGELFLTVRARLEYAHGRHLQTDLNVDEAEERFSKGLEYCEMACRTGGQSNSIEEAKFLTAILMIALARVSIDRGQLTRAWRQVLVARTMFSGLRNDPLYIAYLDFLRGSILRQWGKLADGIPYLEQAVRVFKESGHERYFHRAQIELAKAYYRQHALDKATGILEKSPSQDVVPEKNEHTLAKHAWDRWNAEKDLLLARIAYERQYYDTARKLAENAYKVLENVPKKFSNLRAVTQIVRAQVALKLRQYDAAIEYCKEGLARQPTDENDRGWLLLVLAEGYLRNRDINRAYEQMDEWKRIEPKAENVYIREYAELLTKELTTEVRGFFIAHDEKDAARLNYQTKATELRNFLVQRVRDLYRNEKLEVQAQILGIKRQTLANWLADMRKNKVLDR